MVTYVARVDEDDVFRALADPTRRQLLDALSTEDGQTLTSLEARFEMTRFGVMKHLKVLEGAGLVVTRRDGREKRHFLNAVPIRLIHDRWVSSMPVPSSMRRARSATVAVSTMISATTRSRRTAGGASGRASISSSTRARCPVVAASDSTRHAANRPRSWATIRT